jgi:hypothetical protein
VRYYIISNDSVHSDHYLTFLNDSMAEISSVPRTMSGMARTELLYKKIDGNLVITTNTNSVDSLVIKNFGFSNDKELVIRDRALVNSRNSEVYVVRSDFKKNPAMFIFCDGKEFKQNMGKSDGYGLVNRSPRRNRRLERKLKSINNFDDYEIKLHKGYDAYLKYGYKYVFGVIELIRKE